MVFCPHCRHESADPQFCDHCNRQLPADASSELPASVALAGGRVIDCSPFRGVWPADCFRPLLVADAVRPLRVYALGRSRWAELRRHVERRAALRQGPLAPIEIVPVGDGAVVVASALPAASALPPDCGDEFERVERTLAALRLLGAAIAPLHDAGLVWLNFDPAAVEIGGDQIRVSNLDLQVFPAGTTPGVLRLSPAYSPPEVCGFVGEKIGPATDVYHLALYAYYRLAGLLPDGFAGQGLEAFDFEIPPLRIYRPSLPPGIAPVLELALARDANDRFATPADLLDEFASAVDRLRVRRSPGPSFRWDCGAATAIGRSHELLGLPNQDAFTLLSLAHDRAVFLVADGVTTCSVGSGDLASRLTIDVLATQLPWLLRPGLTLGQIEEALVEGCSRASNAILQSALAEGVAPGTDPAELMSSTVLIGYAHGDVLSLACVGDSRAYLVQAGAGVAEQLTVDGDVRCVHLAHGSPPEQVRDLGADALALFSCLGVGQLASNGSLVRCPARTRPQVTHWPMRSLDVVVLATDGLVEEGVFLDPGDLAHLTREMQLDEQELMPAQFEEHLTVDDLAAAFVWAACQRHRDASPWEPYGHGDDVTCIVLRASRPEPP